MTLILSGHTYKYEIEALLKLFYPAESFAVADNDNIDGDYAFTELRKSEKGTVLTARVRIGDRIIEHCDDFSGDDAEAPLCRLLYRCLSEATGIVPPWGMLTGVRPVKLARRLSVQGLSDDEIIERYNRDSFVSPEAMRLACEVYHIQKPLLDGISPKSFALYVGIPFCPTRCSYCSFISQAVESSKKLIPEYVRLLAEELREIGRISSEFGIYPDSVYFGGGTPTTLDAEMLDCLLSCIEESFDLSKLREYTVEAGRPDTITAEKLRTLKAHGVERLSINPQTMNDEVLRVIGRCHSAERLRESYELARGFGFKCINMDLIAGLPADSRESFLKTVSEVIEMSPENVTVHTLTLKRSATLYQNHPPFIAGLGKALDEAESLLRGAGYRPYYLYRQKNTAENRENIGYSKPGHDCLYNVVIMDECQSIIGAGCGSSTKLLTDDTHISRFFDYKYPFEYVNDFARIIADKSKIRDFYKRTLG